MRQCLRFPGTMERRHAAQIYARLYPLSRVWNTSQSDLDPLRVQSPRDLQTDTDTAAGSKPRGGSITTPDTRTAPDAQEELVLTCTRTRCKLVLITLMVPSVSLCDLLHQAVISGGAGGVMDDGSPRPAAARRFLLPRRTLPSPRRNIRRTCTNIFSSSSVDLSTD